MESTCESQQQRALSGKDRPFVEAPQMRASKSKPISYQEISHVITLLHGCWEKRSHDCWRDITRQANGQFDES
ncbi:hypothetical protein AAFF_G00430330 [Aldrovandia affinis]|uniref:Uncharacterized protein n=1 Tax=Aldrovandia affinis TaxID=143900 RepID=A0AAD7WJD3_9TELE|nr:hypothetical protein AAFF_G00430330 [Aldrovandia affinis]